MSTPTFIMAIPWDLDRVRSTKALRDETGATVVWDQKHDAMDTWLRMMHTAGDGPGIFLEDDIDLAPAWRTLVEEEIEDHRDEVIQFFSMRKADLETGSRREPGRTFSMNQCYYLPKGYAAAIAEFAPTWLAENPGSNAYDWLMGAWLKEQGLQYWVRVPSLVQHKQWKSAIHPTRSSKRQSPTFGQETPTA